MKQYLYFLFLSFTVFCLSCATDKADEITPFVEPEDTTMVDSTDKDTTGTTPVSFKEEVLPIFKTNCTDKNCHNPTPGPYPWLTHADISAQTDKIIAAIEHTGPIKMPFDPSTFTPTDKLPQATIDIIKKWIEEGKKDN